MKPASLVAALLLPVGVVSGLAAAEPLSLNEIWSLALRGNAEWAAVGYGLEGARIGLERAHADRGPTFSLLSRFSEYSEPHRIVIPAGVIDENPRKFDIGSEAVYQFTLFMSQELYTGGAATARIAIAGGDYNAGLARRAAAREDLLLALTRSVVDLQKALGELDVVLEERKQAQAHLATAQGFLEHRLITRLDVLQAQIRLSEVERRLVSARSAADLARARLNVLLGRPLQTPLEPAADLPFRSPVPELDECRQTALSRRPELALLRGTAERSRGQVKLARSQYLPKLSLFGSFTRGYDPTFLTADDRFWNVGATISWSLWDYGRRGLELDRASASAQEVEMRIKSTEEEISLEVLAAHQGVVEKDVVLRSLESTVEMARENLRLARERYAEGLGRGLDVLDAQTLWARTETERHLALLDAQMARAELLHAMGVLSDLL